MNFASRTRKAAGRPLAGSVAAVTGAGKGIGRAAALALAAAGADLAICARGREVEETSRLAVALGARVMVRRLNVADRAAVRGWIRSAVRRFGRLDVLVNNAGLLGPQSSLADYPADAAENLLAVNVLGALHAAQAAVEFSMRRRRRGVIVNVGSGAGRVGRAGGGMYSASKFALEGLTQVLAAELAPRGIAVCSLNPGPTRTAMRAAYDPAENPKTVKPAESLGPAFVFLARLKPRPVARRFNADADGRLKELPPADGR